MLTAKPNRVDDIMRQCSICLYGVEYAREREWENTAELPRDREQYMLKSRGNGNPYFLRWCIAMFSYSHYSYVVKNNVLPASASSYRVFSVYSRRGVASWRVTLLMTCYFCVDLWSTVTVCWPRNRTLNSVLLLCDFLLAWIEQA